MKKKILILCSLIGVLLVFYSFPIYAEDSIDPASPSPQIDLPDYALDSYFYDNYDLLPYIQSIGNQGIDTGVVGKSDLKIDLVFSDLVYVDNSGSAINFLFSSNDSQNNRLGLAYSFSNEQSRLFYYTYQNNYSVLFDNYVMYDVLFDNNEVYLNHSLVYSFTESDYVVNSHIYIFRNGSGQMYTGHPNYSSYKLYKFSIYDYDLNDGEGGYVRYYYPAKAKASGVIGLYDSISKTFVTTSGSVPFASPTDDNVLNFQISDLLTAGLGWIGDIFTAIIDMPLILMFMAIGLAGVAFRWARRVVHF